MILGAWPRVGGARSAGMSPASYGELCHRSPGNQERERGEKKGRNDGGPVSNGQTRCILET